MEQLMAYDYIIITLLLGCMSLAVILRYFDPGVGQEYHTLQD
jgi:hypothetical protein